jgi:hypothetical protein
MRNVEPATLQGLVAEAIYMIQVSCGHCGLRWPTGEFWRLAVDCDCRLDISRKHGRHCHRYVDQECKQCCQHYSMDAAEFGCDVNNGPLCKGVRYCNLSCCHSATSSTTSLSRATAAARQGLGSHQLACCTGLLLVPHVQWHAAQAQDVENRSRRTGDDRDCKVGAGCGAL